MGTIVGVGASGTVASASGGKVYGFNNIGAVTQVNVAPANPSRTKIVFHNPGTVDMFIVPQYLQNTGSAFGSNVANALTTSALGGGFRVYANGGTLEIEGECQGAWYALAASGTNNALTVMDSNVA